MARKHEHFGLSYLEELSILKERENICKESRQKFLKFKQEIDTDHTDLNTPLLKITPPDEPPQLQSSSFLSSRSLPLLFESTPSDIFDTGNETEDVTTQEKKYLKKEVSVDKKESNGFGKEILEYKNDSLEEESEKRPVVIASLVGTSKQLIMLKKPEPPPKHKYRKIVRTKSHFKSSIHLQTDNIDIEQPQQKILSEHAVPASLSMEIDESYSMVSSLSEKPSKIYKEISKTSLLSSQFDLDRSCSKKSIGSSSVKSASESVKEALAGSRSNTSKDHVRHSSRSKSQVHASIEKFSSGMVSRSIDEIIASLKSTAPTASDLRIKELLESILGQDYSIKIEPSPVRKEPRTIEFKSAGESSSEQVTSADAEQTKLESLSSDKDLLIKGKAFPKVKPVEIEKGLEDLSEQQPVSLLSTWTTKIKDVDYPLIHLLCMASPRCVLPVNLQLVSRVHHTLDKKGHNVLLPSINISHHKPEELFPATAAFEEQMERERICNEGLPISEVYQCSQEDGIKVLPPQSPRSMPEWQRVAEFYVEKPQLKLLGEKVKFHPASLKMFWTPAPQKFSAPLSLMKKTLFSKYESNMINGVIYEDFSCDLREEEESESEDDFDNLLSQQEDPQRHEVRHSPESMFSAASSRDYNYPSSCHRHRSRSSLEWDRLSDFCRCYWSPRYDYEPQHRYHDCRDWDSYDRHCCDDIEYHCWQTHEGVTRETDVFLSQPRDDRAELPRQAQTIQPDPLLESLLRITSRQSSIGHQAQSLWCECTDDHSKNFSYRSISLGKLHAHNKFSIKVSHVVQCYRSPSLPCMMDFEKFAEKQGRKPDNFDNYVWARTIWIKWFDEIYSPTAEDKVKSVSSKKDMEEKTTEKELVDTVNPLLWEGKTDELEQYQSEIDKITQLINEGCSAFHYCRRGAIYRKIGKLKSAMDDLEKAISLEPMLVNAYWHRHLLFLYQNKISPALEDLNFIIKCNKNNADAYLSRADIYKKQEDNSLAIINYTLAMRCRPTDDEIYYKRGEAYEENGDLLLAMEDYSKCLYYNPKRTDALMKRGRYYFNRSYWVPAINDFTTVIKEDPNNSEARTYRGRAYIKQEQYNNAVEDLAAAIHLNPCNWIAYYYRGCTLRKVDPKQALQDLSISVLLNHSFDNLSAFLHRGVLYSELKQWLLAICDFESALALDRTLVTAHVNIGLILMLHLDNYFESIRQFTQAIQVDPLDTRPYLCRAQAYHKIHDLKRAVRDLNRAIHLQPNSPQLCLTRGQYLLEMRNYDLASFCIHQVAEMDEGSLECSLVQEALVHSFCQNHKKAIECAFEVTKKQPEPAMFVLLGKIQMKAKKHKDAVASFKQALKLLTGSAKAPPNTFEAAEIYLFMGQCYMEQVALLEACDAFTSAVKLYPRYADAYYQRGLCRMQLQQAKCILDFNKTLAVLPTHFQAYLSRAAYFGSKGRYSKAIMNCTEAIKIEPNSVRAYLYRGTMKFYNRTYKHAVEDLTRAIDLDNACTLAYYNRAIAFHQLKDWKNALKDYGIVLLLEASDDTVLKVLINRALLYTELDLHDNALEDFSDVGRSKPKDTRLCKVIGLCYHRLQKYEEAVHSFSKLLKLDPFSLDGYIGRGNSYMEFGHEQGNIQARKDFLKAVHLNPTCIKARLCLGYNLQALGKFQKAWAQFTAAILIDPKCHLAYDGRAIVCLQMGDYFAAFQDTNAALKITASAELLTNRGVINQFMGFLNCAMKDYQQAITVDPSYALAYFNAANIYFLNRQFSQANKHYSKALTLDPKNESAFLNRAITNTLLKNFEEAKEDFEKAISLSPFSAAIYYNKANLYSTLQQYEQAEEDISKALSIQPYDALMFKLRADIRGKMGLIKEAITDYKKAISIQELISTG
ncbi:tetratricopeptide repeat protein 6 [Elgaria multicarinata webbii]|uniref:tetratricopeptide repeat protein 6 n=1 Tax=Elgaria multicarinata webbii TaxID=159646 RepID=UPI002FCD1EBF